MTKVPTPSRSLALLVLAATGALAGSAHAVIVYGPQGRNLSAPTGDLANTGWQFFGQLNNGFSGWPIGPKHFLTAHHPDPGSVSLNLTLPNGSTYTSFSRVNIAGSDLSVFEITGTFTSWAPLWDASTDGSEIGRNAIIFGRGLPRTVPVYAPLPLATEENPNNLPSAAPTSTVLPTSAPRPPLGPTPLTGGVFRGYEWDAVLPSAQRDRAPSWGTNVIDEFVTHKDWGEQLKYDFSSDAGPNEGSIVGDDSGGAVFVQNSAGEWKLAAINTGIDLFYRSANEGFYYATLFDARGFYRSIPNNGREMIPLGDGPVAGSGYSSRVAAFNSALQTYTSSNVAGTVVPEPALLATGAALVLLSLRRRKSSSTIRSMARRQR